MYFNDFRNHLKDIKGESKILEHLAINSDAT